MQYFSAQYLSVQKSTAQRSSAPSSSVPCSSVRTTLACLMLTTLLAGCAADGTKGDGKTGVTANFTEQKEIQREGNLDDRILQITDGADTVNPQWRVNGFLWRAALDTFSFLPLRAFNTVAGSIETDWYSAAQAPGTRYRVSVQITSTALIPSSLNVTLFTERRSSPSSRWVAVAPKREVVRKLEDAVLSKARQLRLTALEIE